MGNIGYLSNEAITGFCRVMLCGNNLVCAADGITRGIGVCVGCTEIAPGDQFQVSIEPFVSGKKIPVRIDPMNRCDFLPGDLILASPDGYSGTLGGCIFGTVAEAKTVADLQADNLLEIIPN